MKYKKIETALFLAGLPHVTVEDIRLYIENGIVHHLSPLEADEIDRVSKITS